METITDVLCPVCGSLCDDLIVDVEDNTIIGVRDACKMGEGKLLCQGRIKSPMIRVDGKLKEVTYDEAINKAAEILSNSKRPLMYGWSSTVCEAQKKGVELAAELGAVIDSTASVCHGPSVLAIQGVGLPTCTLGQIKNRADLVIYWGTNQSHAHPRHMSRYSGYSKGLFSEEGRKGRHVMVFDVRHTETANVVDEFVLLKPGTDYAIFSALRTILAGHSDVVPDEVGGISKEKLVETIERMKSAKFGVIFFGMGLTQSRGHHKNIWNAISLVDELNAHTKFTIMAMRGHFNVAGFGQVLTWETGFPFAIDFSKGYPWYNPGETAAVDVLNREECDSALIIASDPAANFPKRPVEYLAGIPVIQIDPYRNPTNELADIVIPSAVVGIEAEGTAYRMDSVPLRLRKLVDSDYLTDEEILDRILKKVRELKGAE